MKKISFLIDSLEGGGAEKVFLTLANYISNYKQINSEIVLVKKKGVYLNELSKKINVLDLKSKRTLYCLIPLIKFMYKTDSDLIIGTQIHVNVMLIIAKFFVFNKISVIVRETSTPSQLFNNILNNVFLKKIVFYLLSVFYKLNKLIICPSNGVAEDLINNFKVNTSKILIINNPIDFDIIDQKKNEHIQDKFFLEEKKMIISIGRLDKFKNFFALIEVFKEIYIKYNLRLSIIGEGPERENIQNFIDKHKLENHVKLIGFVSNPYKYVYNSTIFATTSLFEGFPNSLLEALCLGIPCVAYDCKSGPREILNNGKYGYLVKMGDKNKFRRSIEHILNGKIKKSAKDDLIKKYHIKYISEKYINILRVEK